MLHSIKNTIAGFYSLKIKLTQLRRKGELEIISMFYCMTLTTVISKFVDSFSNSLAVSITELSNQILSFGSITLWALVSMFLLIFHDTLLSLENRVFGIGAPLGISINFMAVNLLIFN